MVSQRGPALKERFHKQEDPKVGIIFVVPGPRVLIECAALADAETYGEFLGHARGHEQFWEDLQHQGQVDRDQDYIEVPRGRVTFSIRTGQYSLLLDRCILRQANVVREIRQRMNLPRRSLLVAADGHYRCAVCMSKGSL